jgi:undecaprenyl pyrophosphate phosphatase UppP
LAEIIPLNFWQAIILGFIQGIGEFFPISSSTHLLLARKWIGLDQHNLSLILFVISVLQQLSVLPFEKISSIFGMTKKNGPYSFLRSLPCFQATFYLKK